MNQDVIRAQIASMGLADIADVFELLGAELAARRLEVGENCARTTAAWLKAVAHRPPATQALIANLARPWEQPRVGHGDEGVE